MGWGTKKFPYGQSPFLKRVCDHKGSNIYRSNSCSAGLGGYSHKGFTGQYYLAKNLKFWASNNLLEHLAAIITPCVNILTGWLKDGGCALSMTDNTTSEGWLKKTNFIEDGEEPIQATIWLEVAHHHATNYLLGGIQEYSQWFRGTDNNVADALSRDNDRSDDELTNILRTHCHSQLPQHFKNFLLLNKITSWLTLLLFWLPVKQQLEEEHSRTKLGCGSSTQSTATLLALDTTHSSTGC